MNSGQTRERLREQQQILDHLALAEQVARRFFRGDRTSDEDLVQVAYVGLIKAVRRFDRERGESFESYAVPTITGELKRYLRDYGWIVRPPRRLQELRAEVAAAMPRVAQRLGHTPTLSDIAEELGESHRAIDEAIGCTQGMYPASLDARVGTDETTSLSDLIPDQRDEIERIHISAVLWRAASTLTDRERRVIYLRFFEERSQQQIAHELGVTQMQVSRILAKTLERMRTAIVYGTRPPRGDGAPRPFIEAA